MTYPQNTPFEARAGLIRGRRQGLAGGGEIHIGPDGLLTVRRRRQRWQFPLRGFLIVVVTAFLAKAGLYIHLGPAAYAEKLAMLEQGNGTDRAGARLMVPDPVTVAIAETVQPYLK